MPVWVKVVTVLTTLPVWCTVVAVSLAKGQIPSPAIMGVPAAIIIATSGSELLRSRHHHKDGDDK